MIKTFNEFLKATKDMNGSYEQRQAATKELMDFRGRSPEQYAMCQRRLRAEMLLQNGVKN